ncbi:hypothetical protein BD779DRAFT_1782192 [Infundibulicybe gibba]|nr:hypothetical protein BD779DRAFT_1782192 [Infundibulicybe gibba]
MTSKQTSKDKKRVDRSLAQSKESLVPPTELGGVTPAQLREALELVKTEEGPKTPEEKENYFMTQVGMGEQLASKGPAFYLPAAMSFFRALRVYPSPVELIVIYQKTVPEPIFKLVMDMTNLDEEHSTVEDVVEEETSPTRGSPPSETSSSQEWDKGEGGTDWVIVKARVEGYYNHFPPKSTNVSVETREGGRKALIVQKDFAAGELIYKENPAVAALDADLEATGKYCSHCFRLIQSAMSIQPPPESNPLSSTYCSKDCMVASKSQSQSLLFSLDPPLPLEIAAAPPQEGATEARRQAQEKFVEYLKKEARAAPMLVARFIARQVAVETSKMVQDVTKSDPKKSENDFTDADGGDYLLADHMERLRYLEVTPPKEELPLLVEVLKTALPGLEQFVTEERHSTLLGKMKYNAFGITYGGGRDDKPEPTDRPEDVEKTRTPYGTARQIGCAHYTLSSYLTHSCVPSTRPSFSNGTTELHLIANRDLKKGDELTVAFVDVTQHTDESIVECRRRRRIELARGWKFACGCARCEEEGLAMTVEEKGGAEQAEQKDESKIEASLSRYEGAEEGPSNVD